MQKKTKYQELQPRWKSSLSISVILHAVIFLLLNFAAMYIFKTEETNVVYIELDSRSIPPGVTSGGKDIQSAEKKRIKRTSPVTAPEITDDEENDVVIDDILPEIEPGTGGGNNSAAASDPVYQKSLAELKILIAEDIKKNYGKTDQERIRRVWRKYLEEHPYGVTYEGYLGDKGSYIPLDGIYGLFNNRAPDSLYRILDTLTGLRKKGGE